MSALNDKVVIVTGESSGIGKAAALSFASKGAKVVITARRAAPLDETAADHPNMIGLVADAAAPDDAVRAIAKAIDSWSRLDVVVNNAGAGAILPLADATADRITKLNELLQAGAIDQATYARAVEDANDRALRSSQAWTEGATRFLKDYVAESNDGGQCHRR